MMCAAMPTCNIVIYSKNVYLAIRMRNSMRNIYLVIHPQFLAHRSQNPWNSLSDKGNEIIFGLLSSVPENTSGKVTSGSHAGMGAGCHVNLVIREWNFQSHPLISWEGRGLEVESIASGQ